MHSGEIEIEFGDEAGKQTETASIVPTGGCPLAPNANEEYKLCDGSGSFRCFLACGKGCVGCEVKTGAECGTDGKCDMNDAKDQTHTYNDAKCFNPAKRRRPCRSRLDLS